MKRSLLILSMFLLAVTAAFARPKDHKPFGPAQAYAQITKIAGLNPADSAASTIKVPGLNISQIREVKALGLNLQQTVETSDQVFRVIGRLPLSSLVIGGSNGQVAAFIYSRPLSGGLNEVLIIAFSAPLGFIQASYAVTDNSSLEVLRNSTLSVSGTTLLMPVGQSTTDYFFNLSD